MKGIPVSNSFGGPAADGVSLMELSLKDVEPFENGSSANVICLTPVLVSDSEMTALNF